MKRPLRNYVGFYFIILALLITVTQNIGILWLSDAVLILTPVLAIGYLFLLIKENREDKKVVKWSVIGLICIALVAIAFPLWLLNL